MFVLTFAITREASRLLLLHFLCTQQGDGCVDAEARARVTDAGAGWFTAWEMSRLTLALISTPILGTLSDRLGRRTIVLLVCVGTALRDACNFAALFTSLPHLLVLGSVVEALFGGFPTMVTTVNSYVSDVSSGDDKHRRIGGLAGIGKTRHGPEYMYIRAASS